MSALEVTFVSPEETIWSGRAAQVVVPAVDGSMGILPQMQPTLAALGTGQVRVIAEDGAVEAFAVSGGFASMDEDRVMLVVDSAERRTERSSAGI